MILDLDDLSFDRVSYSAFCFYSHIAVLPFVCDSGCARVYLITRRFVTLFYTVLADTSGFVMPLVPPGLQLGGMEYISLVIL